MEHILISPGKLKLMLTRDDLEHYELDRAVEDGAVDSSRLAFRSLLDDAGRMSGFDAGDDKLFIQLYPSKDGGAEIYITKLSVSAAATQRSQLNKNERVTLTRIGVFDSMTALLECCARLSAFNADIESSAASDNTRYFLIITESLAYRDYLNGAHRSKIESLIGEYGRNIPDTTALSYVKEHCFKICEKKAVKILGSMV